MKLQFTTSISNGFIEGQVIEVDPPPPQILDWLRRGILRPVRDVGDDVALEPDDVEKAIARRAHGSTRGRAKRVKAQDLVSDETPSVPALCPGGTVAIFAGGPSLTQSDVDRCRGRVDVVIGINNTYQLAPWVDILYAADSRWWGWHKQRAHEHDELVDPKTHTSYRVAGLKFALQPEAAHWPGVQVLRNTGVAGLELDPTGLRTGKNSGYQALNVAVHCGAKRVLLLGFDMQKGPNGENHWHGNHPGNQPVPLQSFVPMFDSLLVPLKQIGVEVLNCTPRTLLTAFPLVPLEEAL